MKNIFILPAKSFKSKLAIYLNKEHTELHEVGELAFCKDDIGWSDFWRPQELYITSEEALKPGDWYINTSLDLSQQAPEIHAKKSDFVAHKKDPLFKYCKKIFLTTDPVLGIKEVPDTFLEYLVKHPLCDEIKITFEESCCGKCDGVNNICFADMVCEKHKMQGCEKGHGKKFASVKVPEKEIVGYRIKPNIDRYMVDTILKNAMPIWNQKDKAVYFIRGHVEGCLVAKLKELQVLDLWFTPIYEDEEILSDWMQQRHYEYYLKEGYMSLNKDREMIDFVEWVLINYPNQHSYMQMVQKIRGGIRVPEYTIKGFYTTEQLLKKFKKRRV